MGAQGYVAPLHARWLTEEPGRAWRRRPATLVFADVSGFTAMSERLDRRGKIGAEETTAAINRVFEGLLRATRIGGGEILKFGGDAVLAYFEGDGHEIRGAAAALQMQSEMRSLRRLQTLAGTVSLRLSAGVASGEAHCFLAGSAPRDLLLSGPLASAVVACEAAADPGEVVVSPATAAALPERAVGRIKGPGPLIHAVGAVPMVTVPEVPAGADLRAALPSHLHDHEPADGEHRFASIAFVQFRGADALVDAPDALADALGELMETVGAACGAHGVTLVSTDVDSDGGKVILAAGAPVASPDDEDRLVHALRWILSGPSRLTVRAGVNRGRVFVGDIGTDERRVWTVMGDAVNLAARVMGRAEPGTLLATPAVLERLRDDFERTPVEPFMVKGKTEPVLAEAIGEARATRRVTTARMAPLVGRERELGMIGEGLAAARAGEQRIVELVGEPGIGKSRLVEAALAEAGGMRVVTVAGGPYSAHSPYRALHAPLRELIGVAAEAPDDEVERALRAVVADRVPQLAAWVPLIAVAFSLDLPATERTVRLAPEFARERLNGLLGVLVGVLLGSEPTLLVVEDAHWLDESTGVFVAHVAQQGREGAGHMVLATRRAEGASLFDEARVTTLRLEPLDTGAATAMLARGDEDSRLPPGAAATLIERAGGNPLLLQELVAAARAGMPLESLPASVEALVMSQIDTLPQRDRRFVRHAAVVGAQVSLDLLGDVLELDAETVAATLGRCSDFLVPAGPGRVRFRHALIRDAAYEALSFRRRRELHAALAELLRRRAGDDDEHQAELLAIHYHAAGAWEPTWRYARVAAEQALARAAPVEAIGFFDRALEAARSLRTLPAADVARVAECQGDAAALAGRPEQAIRAYRLARRHLTAKPVHCATLYFKEGRQLEGARSFAQGLSAYTRGLRVLDGAGTDGLALRAKLILAHGAARFHAGRRREALPFLDEAVRLAQRAGADDTLAHAYYVLEATHSDLGTGEAERYRGLALPIFEAKGDDAACARVLNNDGATAYFEGRWDDAVAAYERSARASHRIGDVVGAALTQANIAEVRSDQNRLDEAEGLLREALGTWRAAGYPLGVGYAQMNLGVVTLRRGDVGKARELLVGALELLTSVGAAMTALEAEARLAQCELTGGDAATALRRLGGIRARAVELGAPPTLLSGVQRLAGIAKQELGDPAAARVRFEEALELARSVDARYEEGQALHHLGELGDAQAAARARELLDGLGVRAPAAVS